MKIKTRFAPSPTGYLHVGGARTALFSWLFARHHQGEFVLRIEDTDVERSTPEAVQAIFDGMNWLGLTHDEGPYFQMQRMDRYKEVIQQMLQEGNAYYCYCSKEELDNMRAQAEARKDKISYDGRWRPELGKTLPPIPAGIQPVVRFKTPADGVTIVEDLIHGPIEFANKDLDDLIIARSDGVPTYNFCVVVDDMDMGITHVIRGDDHINNTPRQINILRALSATVPKYAHVAMILGPDGKKLSKRHGAVSVIQYHEQGYLPEAMLNYLVRLGWSHGDQEIFSLQEMIQLFNLESINKSPSMFDFSKLMWLNQQYMIAMEPRELVQRLQPFIEKAGLNVAQGPDLLEAVRVHVARAQTLVELTEMLAYLYRNEVSYDADSVAKHLTTEAKPVLEMVEQRFDALSDWNPAEIDQAVKATMAELGIKMPKIAQPLRVAIVGKAASPGIGETLWLTGKERTLQRIQAALKLVA